ncbi:Ig-like domain-containing protein [Membranihabitans marinus]|uniref:Ig-like domain-containing protein n=1 Tax=Membranihabitans marinus TaxID=1227546 RepID=UPI001F3E0123|nr:Ig-like domain-containing protein [Membranihabitans marinus]
MLLFQCASPGSIQGGPKDENPPRVDSLASSPNPSLRFDGREIVLYFNEWVQLEDPYQQIFISPPFTERPNYKLKGRSLIIEIDEEEELTPNTTYIINLGKAIVDLNESNPLPDYQYVFSTGDFLDSLSINGKAIDQITGEPLENISMMLFDNLSDTAITTVSPSYFARSNAEGEFKFQYLRPGEFQLIGFLDENQDFKYDADTESFGFSNTIVNTLHHHDTTITLPISLGRPPIYLDDVDTSYHGLIQLTFTEDATDTAMMSIRTSDSVRLIRDQKVANIWYEDSQLPLEVITRNTAGISDTMTVNIVKQSAPAFEDIKISKPSTPILAHQPIRLTSTWPIVDLDVNNIEIVKNKNEDDILRLDSFHIDFNQMDLYYPWQVDSNYLIQFLPQSITFKDSVVQDSLSISLKPVSTESLSSIIINFLVDSSQYTTNQWIVELMQKDKQLQRFIINDLEKPLRINHLKPGEYQLRLTKDENKNGIWDAARFYEKKQAEELLNIDIGTIRVNWIQETEIKIP